LNIEKINFGSSWPRFIIQQLVALSNALAPTLDASQTVGGITKLCRKSGMDISRFGMFPERKQMIIHCSSSMKNG
jgi:hypothetical protein